MVVKISPTRGPKIYQDDTFLWYDDLYSVAPEKFLGDQKMLFNLNTRRRNSFLGYVSMVLKDQSFPNIEAEIGEIRNQLKTLQTKADQARTKGNALAASLLLAPGAPRYWSLANEYTRQYNDLNTKLNNLINSVSAQTVPETWEDIQATVETRTAEQLFTSPTPAGGASALQAAENYRRGLEILKQEQAKKAASVQVPAFLIPAAIGAGLGLFL